MKLSDEMLIEMSYVKISKYRTQVIKSLQKEMKIPSQIVEDTDILQNHMSATLNQLRDHGLVECINPEARKGRLYRLTKKGEELANEI